MRIKLYFDGACDNNRHPHTMGIGVAVWINGERAEQYDKALNAGVGTNNIAEYISLIQALKLSRVFKDTIPDIESINIFGDSQLIVYQYAGKFQCKAAGLPVYLAEAKRLRDSLGMKVTVSWVPREQNKEADVLSKAGLLQPIDKTLKLK